MKLGNHRLIKWDILGDFEQSEIMDTEVWESVEYFTARQKGATSKRIFQMRYFINAVPFENPKGRYIKIEFSADFICDLNLSQKDATKVCYPIAMQKLQNIIDVITEMSDIFMTVFPPSEKE